jgi:hypothetical protein
VLEYDRFGKQSELIPEDKVWDVQQTVFQFMYDTANLRLQMIASQLRYFLAEQGHASLPHPAGGQLQGGLTCGKKVLKRLRSWPKRFIMPCKT